MFVQIYIIPNTEDKKGRKINREPVLVNAQHFIQLVPVSSSTIRIGLSYRALCVIHNRLTIKEKMDYLSEDMDIVVCRIFHPLLINLERDSSFFEIYNNN